MGFLEDLAKAVVEKKMAPPCDEVVEEGCPFLWEMLTMSAWKDGSERMLPRIVIERVPGAYRVTLQDDSLCIKKSALAKTLADIPAALEKALRDGEVPFEAFKSYRNKQGPKAPDEKKTGRKRG